MTAMSSAQRCFVELQAVPKAGFGLKNSLSHDTILTIPSSAPSHFGLQAKDDCYGRDCSALVALPLRPSSTRNGLSSMEAWLAGADSNHPLSDSWFGSKGLTKANLAMV